MKNTKSALFVVAAGIFWGLSCIAVDILDEYSLTSIEMGFLRMVSCAVCMFFGILIYKPSLLKFNIRDIWMFIGTGIFSLTFFNWCYYTTIIESEASVAVSLLYTSPVWVMIFSAILFKEKITFQKIIAMAATIAGCALVTGLIGNSVRLSFKILMIGLGAGVGYALYSVFGRYATEKYNSLTITFYTFLFSAIGYGFMIKPAEIVQKCSQSALILPIAAAAGIICGVLPYTLYTVGLKRLEPTTAAILAATEPLVGSLIGILFLGDAVSFSKILGIALILTAIVMPNVDFTRIKNKCVSRRSHSINNTIQGG